MATISDVPSADAALIKVGASWCAACQSMAPHLRQFERENDMLVVRVDADESPRFCDDYGVKSLPTLLLFRNGELVDRRTGNPGSARAIAQFAAQE